MAKKRTAPEAFQEDWALLRRKRPKTYVGRRQKNGGCVVRVVDDAGTRKLPLARTLHNHSLAFEWGYGGSGPAQLALAILYDYLADSKKALHLHQKFKFMVVAHLPKDGWSLPDTLVKEALKILENSEKTETREGSEQP